MTKRMLFVVACVFITGGSFIHHERLPMLATKGPIVMSLHVEFTDRVTDFGSDGDRVTVLFEKQAASFHLSPTMDDFARQVSNLAAAWKSKKPAKVVTDGVDIVSVEPAA